MKVGITGSRNWPKRRRTEIDAVLDANRDRIDTIITGGAQGPDTWAAEWAKKTGIRVLVCKPDLTAIRGTFDMVSRYHARNRKIVEASDAIIAFLTARKGGTWFTVKEATRQGKPVVTVYATPEAAETQDREPYRLTPMMAGIEIPDAYEIAARDAHEFAKGGRE